LVQTESACRDFGGKFGRIHGVTFCFSIPSSHPVIWFNQKQYAWTFGGYFGRIHGVTVRGDQPLTFVAQPFTFVAQPFTAGIKISTKIPSPPELIVNYD
jgi:hypothetical protein